MCCEITEQQTIYSRLMSDVIPNEVTGALKSLYRFENLITYTLRWFTLSFMARPEKCLYKNERLGQF